LNLNGKNKLLIRVQTQSIFEIIKLNKCVNY